jgi:hypothetical protein
MRPHWFLNKSSQAMDPAENLISFWPWGFLALEKMIHCPTTQEARRIHSEMSRQLFTSLCHRTNFTWRIEFGLVTLRDERQAHHGRT